MNKGSPLMTAIERATSETLLRPDPSFNSSVKDLINSRPDMPKEAIQILKKRIVARNPKVQILTLELLDFLVQALPLPFHTQVSSRDFMGTLSQIFKSKDVEVGVKNRLKELLISWYRRFADSKDILPGFSDIYLQLKLGSEMDRTDSRPLPFTQVSQSSPPKPDSSKKLPDSKVEKLKKDLQVVRDNVNLTKDMIQARESPSSETLVELASTLKVMEGKILKLIERLEDSEMLDYCLNVKDELQDVIRNYDDYKNGKAPNPADRWGLIDEPYVPVKQAAQDLLFDSPVRPHDAFGQPVQSIPLDLIGNPVSSSYMFNPPIHSNPVNVPPVSNTSSSFDSLFGSSLPSGQNLVGSAFATNPSISSPAGQFISQPVGTSPFVATGPSPQGNFGFSGNEILGLNLNPFNTAGPAFPVGPPVVGNPSAGFGIGNLASSNPGPGYSAGFSQAPGYSVGNVGNPQNGGNFERQAKVNVNYTPSQNFEDPFSTSLIIGAGTGKPSAQVRSPKGKEKNFDELFDFKF